LLVYLVAYYVLFQEAKVSYGSFRELMWNLVFKVELDELQKARWADHVTFGNLYI